ncbi:MAG: TonB-dependent receptor [Pseudomonadota bacterium]
MRVSTAALGLACLATPGALAQESPDTAAPLSEEASSVLDVVRVTAQKREESVLEVPSSLTVFSKDAIEFNRIDDLEDFAIRSPNVKIASTGNPNRSNVSIRGISRLGGSFNSVGVYIDEFNIAPFNTNGAINPVLFEVEQIEVLRGPQGVFFGRNSTSGAINITTRKPSTDAVSGSASVEGGSFGTGGVRGFLNVPLGGQLAATASGFFRSTNGFINDVGPAGADNELDEFGGRLALRWTPTSNLTLDLSGAYSERDGGSGNLIPNGDVPATAAAGFAGTNAITQSPLAPLLGLPPLPALPDFQGLGVFPENTDTVAFDVPANFENQNISIIGKAVYDFGPASFILTGGYTDNDYSETIDGDFTATPVFVGNFNNDLSSWSIEGRFESNEDLVFGDFDFGWSFGVGYYEADLGFANPFFSIADSPFNPVLFAAPGTFDPDATPGIPDSVPPLTPPGPLFGLIPGLEVSNPFGTTDSESIAGFFNTSLTYADRVELQFGGRISHEDIAETGGSVLTTLLGPDVLETSGSDDFTDFSPRIALSYFLNDEVTFYSLASRGYRAGGVDFAADGTPIPFDEENVWNFEGGVKAALFDNRLFVNLAGFYIAWDDLQVLQFDFAINNIFTQNADTAEAAGVEFEFTAKPHERLTFNGGFGFVDAEFGNFPGAIDSVTGGIVDVSGGPLPNTSEWTVSLAGRYDQPLFNDYLGYVSLEYIYQDAFNTQVVPNPEFGIEDYNLVNLRVGIEHGGWEAQFFIDNLIDEEFSTGNFFAATSFVGVLETVGRPRTFGGQLSYRF